MKQMKKKKFIYHQKNVNKLLMLQDCFRYNIKMEYQNIANLLGNIPDKVPKFINKKQVEDHDQSGNEENKYKASKQ